MKTLEQIKGFITEKTKEAQFKVNYASELFNKLNLPENGLGKLADDIAENKGIIKAYGELTAFIDSLPSTALTSVGGGIEDNIPIGTKLFTARVRLGKQQKEIAKIIGCAPTAISNWEHDICKPRKKYVSKIEELYEQSKAIPCKQDLEKFKR